MAAAEQVSGNQYIVLSGIRHGAQINVAASELAGLLGVDPPIAASIIKRAPIILFKDVTGEDVNHARPHLVALARVGLDFKITQSPPVNIPKVNWPTNPDLKTLFAEAVSQTVAPVLAKPLDVSVQVLCPCCGSSLQLHILPLGAPFQIDKLKAEDIPAAQPLPGAPPAQAPAAAAVSPAAPVQAAPAAALPGTTDDSLEETMRPRPMPVAAGAATAVAVLPVQETEMVEPWTGTSYDAVPMTAGGEDLDFQRAPGLGIVETLPEPAPPGFEGVEAYETVEAIDGPQEIVEKVDPLSPDTEDLQPWTGSAREYKSGEEEPAELSLESEEPAEDLEPWTGKARDYDAKKEEVSDEVTVAAGDLEPWTGKARDYEARSDAPQATEEPAEDLGAAADAPAEGEPEEELEPWTGKARDYSPETQTATEDGQPESILADVPEGANSALSEGLEDVPEMDSAEAVEVVEPVEAVEEVEPVEEVEEKPKKLKKKKKKKKKKTVMEEAEAPADEPKPKKAKGDDGGDGAYSVFLSKISSSRKKKVAVGLLADIRGIPESEAEALSKKMIIPVVKGVTKDEAEEILTRFRDSKISGRITKKK